MILDCDQRTRRLVEIEVRKALQEMYGSVFELGLFEITHEEDRVIALGEFTPKPGNQEIPFAIVIPRVDSPLDYFL